MRKLHLAIAFFTFAFCVVSGTLWSQSVSTSQVSGTVQDSSGAAMPAATVTMRQTETGQSRATITGPDGAFTLPNLPIGPYQLTVTKDGFATYIQTGIVLNVNTNPIINATMKIGAVSEQVSVQAEALSVETHSSGVGQVISHQEVVELPLNAREPTQLILLAGNATTQGTLMTPEHRGAGR